MEELAVIKVIEANPKITQTDIAKTIKKSASTVKRITSTLVEKGILIRKNGRRNGWWEITLSECMNKPYHDNKGVIWLNDGTDKRKVFQRFKFLKN